MRKFKIPSIPTSTTKSIRFPDTLIEKVENVIRGTDCTFSGFVLESTRMALKSLEKQENDEKGKKDEEENS